MFMSLLCTALLIPLVSAIRPSEDLSDTEALSPSGGAELLNRLRQAFPPVDPKEYHVDPNKRNFVFLDKDGTQTPPADHPDEAFQEAWNDATEACKTALKGKEKTENIFVVTSTGQPFFMWEILVGTAPYAVLSGGNAWVINSKQMGEKTISPENLDKLKAVEQAIARGNQPLKAATRFYYMNKLGMYSLAANPTVDEEFFKYIAGKKPDKKKGLQNKLSTNPDDVKDIEILYVKHCGRESKFDYGLINDFFGHLQHKFDIDFQPLKDEPVNGRVWKLTGKGKDQTLLAMIMLTGGHCEIAISAGDKSTGMEALLQAEGKKANVVMGAGDSGNDVPLQALVTQRSSYFVASPTTVLLKSFEKGNPLGIDNVFKPTNKWTVPGLWFHLPQSWGLC